MSADGPDQMSSWTGNEAVGSENSLEDLPLSTYTGELGRRAILSDLLVSIF